MIKIRFEFNLFINKEKKEDLDLSIHKSEDKKQEADGGDSDFFQRAVEEIQRREPLMSRSTIENYRTALRAFGQYLGRDIALGEVNTDLFKGFENWLMAKGILQNTISCYMRSLRSLTTSVCGTPSRDFFQQVFTGRCKTDKRALDERDIARISDLQLPSHTFLYLARDLFLFSFYAMSMPFVDMAFLQKRQIGRGHILYFRHKTRQRVRIPLEPCMQEIINRYETPDSDYVFPLIKSKNSVKAYNEYLIVINRYNKALKQLAKKAGLSHKLTSYVSRHSWASIAFNSNVDLPLISKALGHANPQNTLIYIKEINDERLTEANRKILRKFEKTDTNGNN